jgi:alpha/beta superfamily hydrolase
VTTVEPRSFTTSDGCTLEGEYARADQPTAAAVLCHPHPQYGGTMRSIVTSALFSALPVMGIACLRFNFRGVEGSGGEHAGGAAEPLDARAAIDVLAAEIADAVPMVLVGWSFGGDVALSVTDERLAGWVGIAPPLRFRADFSDVANDPRPKLLVLGAHDEFRDPDEVVDEVAAWKHTRVEIIPGASHFFVGRTDRVVDAVGGFFDAMREP